MAGDEEKAKGLTTEPIVWKKIDTIQPITDGRSNVEKERILSINRIDEKEPAVTSQHQYMDQIAPISDIFLENDFSSSSLLKN